MIATARTSELFDCRRPRGNDCGIAMTVNKLLRMNDGLHVQVNRNISIELKIIRLLIVGTLLSADGLWLCIGACRIDNDINIFENTPVVFEPKVRFRVYRKQRFSSSRTRKGKAFGVYGNVSR